MLDGQTLQNLEILENGIDKGRKGTLLDLLCHCSSPFGKRLFHIWLCHPLRNIDDIEERLNAIEDFSSNPSLKDELCSLLCSLPDLERLIARVHMGTCKLPLFLDLLDNLDTIHTFISNIQDTLPRFKSSRYAERDLESERHGDRHSQT